MPIAYIALGREGVKRLGYPYRSGRVNHWDGTTPQERRMHLSQFHYLPLTPGFFSILVVLFVGLLVIMIVLGALRHAYLNLGVSPGTAMLLLVASLIGSYFNYRSQRFRRSRSNPTR